MSTEESFVILGTSPTPSLEELFLSNNKQAESTSQNGDERTSSSKECDNDPIDVESEKDTLFEEIHIQTETLKGKNPEIELCESSNKENSSDSEINAILKAFVNLSSAAGVAMNSISQHCESKLPDLQNNSLAASFLLGYIDKEVIEDSMFQQFPNLAQDKKDDVEKIRSFLVGYTQLKANVQKTNESLRKHVLVVKKLQDELKSFKSDQSLMVDECKKLLVKLKTENTELKEEIGNKIEHVKLNENMIREKNNDLVAMITEKSFKIQDLNAQIELLGNQFRSLECVRKSENEEKMKQKSENLLAVEYKAIIKNMEQKISELTAKNLELKNKEEVYCDEINCLKIKLECAEKSLEKAQSDGMKQKVEMISSFVKEKTTLEEEIYALKVQVETLYTDFEKEVAIRKSLARERDGVIRDLKRLQEKNRELVLENKARTEKEKAKNVPSISRGLYDLDKCEREKQCYLCHFCRTEIRGLEIFQEHVKGCIRKA